MLKKFILMLTLSLALCMTKVFAAEPVKLFADGGIDYYVNMINSYKCVLYRFVDYRFCEFG